MTHDTGMDTLAVLPGHSLTNPAAYLGRLTQGGWFPVGRTRSDLLCLTRTAVSIAGIGGRTFSVREQTTRAMFSSFCLCRFAIPKRSS